MDLITIILTAVGLAMDAFAVSISCGLADAKNTSRNALNAGIAFGLFQGGMTAGGWLAGYSFRAWIENIDHWVAFALLGIIGAKMIWEAFEGENECIMLTSLKVLITLAVATSIDALAVGISLSALKIDIVLPAVMIGVITFALSYFGVFLGKMIGCNSKFKKYIDMLGGVILVGIGLKILLEHVL
ncbi:manganese efflux pump MntP [Acetivibrio cellulolyticus]|uniref:manganese efflux pump MntP n=1 Tax=Acetivibrio cellulolyticus TaxID=35830 RepID=UPI0001E2C7CE|nr:manganese efflux pump MntP family protein [Acetivibrio cellulolyticus]